MMNDSIHDTFWDNSFKCNDDKERNLSIVHCTQGFLDDNHCKCNQYDFLVNKTQK